MKSGDRAKHISVVPHCKSAHPSCCTGFQTAAEPIQKTCKWGKRTALLLGWQAKQFGDLNPVPHWRIATSEKTRSQLNSIGSPSREARGSCRLNPCRSTSDFLWGVLARQHDGKLWAFLPASELFSVENIFPAINTDAPGVYFLMHFYESWNYMSDIILKA